MIKGFKSGRYYVLHKDGFDKIRWNSKGRMDFLKDGQPHQCNDGSESFASFFDSPEPKKIWVFSTSLDYFYEVLPKITNWKKEMEVR